MNSTIHSHLCDISRVADRIALQRGFRIQYMPISDRFSVMLNNAGFVPSFDHVKGYGLCWVWMIWDNLKIISRID